MNKLILLLLLTASSVAAQEYITISGNVIDMATNAPLPFAHISLKNSSLGTVSNHEGYFEFHVPLNHRSDTVWISYLSYEHFESKVEDLKTNNKKTIALKPTAVLLKEIEVREKNLTGKEIVEMAIRKIKDNYPTQTFCLEGFFREIEEENEKYTLLTEAAIYFYDDDFTNRIRKPQESVDIKEVRRSYSYTKRNTKDNIGWALMDLLENNDVRYKRGLLNTKNNTYEIDSLILYNDNPVYVIKVKNRFDEGKLYIDASRFAFLKIEADRRSRTNQRYYQVTQYHDSLRYGRKNFSFVVEFQEYQGKYYVKRTQEYEENDFFDPKNDRVLIDQSETLDMIVTNIRIDVKDDNAQRLSYKTNFKIGPYHESFWKNYNTLVLPPLSEKLVKDLERETSLQKQFKTNQ
jgi:hypothetical protein